MLKTLFFISSFLLSVLSSNILFASSSNDPMMQNCMKMMNEELGPKGPNYDKKFIEMMIPHHQGAIDMAKDALSKSNRPEIQQLAKNIIKTQQKEIAEMKKWEKEWYGNSIEKSNN